MSTPFDPIFDQRLDARDAPVRRAEYISGKEVGALAFRRKPDCTIEVDASEVRAFDAIGFYLSKILLPIGLAFDYSRSPSRVLDGPWWPYAAIALVIWYGGRLVSADQLTVGELTAFLLYTGLVAISITALASLYGDFMRAVGSSQRRLHLDG